MGPGLAPAQPVSGPGSSSGREDRATVRVLLASRASAGLAELQGLLASPERRVEVTRHDLGEGSPPDSGGFDLIVLDLAGSGTELPEMPECLTAPPEGELIILGGDFAFDGLAEQLGHRAFHFVTKLGETTELIPTMEAALRQRQLKLENRALRARLKDAEEHKAAQRLANFQAYHDLLTRLPNRALLNDRLELAIAQARRNKHQLALMFLDLDGFKAVNDSLGHHLGDRLLQAVAGRLQDGIRQSDTLARFGGDEFALLLPDLRTPEDAAAIAGKILESLDNPFVIGGSRFSVGASIGIAMYPEAGAFGEMLIRKADIAMYHVKGRGKHAFQFYSPDMDCEHPRQLATERELQGGLIRGELEVYYRPQVNLATGGITAVEAAWRWRHPRRGLVEPGEVLPSFATGAKVAAVHDFLHKQAFQQAVVWRQEGPLAELRLVVNPPGRRLGGQGLVEQLRGNLLAASLDPAALTVQIDENTLMEGAELVGPELQELRNLGVRVMASDFGAGFSSLRYLERLALTGLKLSPTLVRDLRPIAPIAPVETDPCEAPLTCSAARTVTAIAGAAKALGLELAAAGVETHEQIHFLKARGCCEAQGAVFSRALPAADVEALLNDNPFASVVGV